MSQERKNWNQSYSGLFGCSIVAPTGAEALDLDLFISDSGLSSSRDMPVTRSTYSRSSTDIFAMGTAILTPLTLWRLILPSFKPRNWASTLNDLDRSVHVRTLEGSGSASIGQPSLTN